MTTARDHANALAELLRREHGAMADFLTNLAAFDRDRLWVELGYPSVFLFLHRGLGLSRSSAHFRATAARLVQRFPSLIEPIRDGRLCITTVFQLAKVLTPENEKDVLPRFFHCSKQEAMAAVADIRPAAAVPERTMTTAIGHPARADANPVSSSAAPISAAPISCSLEAVHPDELRAGPGSGSTTAPPVAGIVEPSTTPGPSTQRAPEEVPAPVPVPGGLGARPRDELTPLTRDRARFHVTVSRRFLEKLESAKAALSHLRPGATAGELLEEGLDLILAEHARRKGLVAKARPPGKAKDANVPAHVRRAVWLRDRGRCQWPLDCGGVCGSRVRIELDHVRAKALGGKATVDGMRLLCRFHNQFAARLAFGDAWMDRFTRGARAGESVAIYSAGALPGAALGGLSGLAVERLVRSLGARGPPAGLAPTG